MPSPAPRPQPQPQPNDTHPPIWWITWGLVAAGYVTAIALGVLGRSSLAGATLGAAIIATVKQLDRSS